MATKTISISEEAYKRLASLRERENESLSEVINRVTKRHTLREIFGILSGERGEEFEKAIIEGRKMHREMHKKRNERFLKELENGLP